jgi:flavin reductase (DIM6/NTAB) family NADH-FMN oxidoreductase RutF
VTVDKAHFRQVVGAFATGVTIITTGRDGNFHGMTANAFSSLSLDPTLVLVCVDNKARSHDIIERAGFFNVNILSEGQQELSRVFASRELPESHALHGIDFDIGANGVPLLKGCLATMQCRVYSRHDAGDHAIFVGEVLEATLAEDGPPLLYWRSAYRRIEE